MKIFSISDLHLSINNSKPMNIFGPVWDNYLEIIEKDWNKKVDENDVVLIPGDISWAMKFEEALPDLQYIANLKGNKIILRGNHDYWWNSVSVLRRAMPEKMYAIQNDALRIGNCVFCGSRGWTVPENGKHKTENDEKIYKRELLRLELSLQNMQKLKQDGDIVVALMHYPPFNSKNEDSDFTNLLEKYNVNFCVFGHLHSYDKKQKLVVEKNNIKYFLTSCDLVNNKLVEII